VWMGRDDARAVGNLQGGHNPAAAWAAFMKVAVANRPVEHFATKVTFPERLEGEGPALGEEVLENLIDENGMPIEGDPMPPAAVPDGGQPEGPEPLDEAFIDRALGRGGNEDEAVYDEPQ
jgi:penicillin-binding protein 1A